MAGETHQDLPFPLRGLNRSTEYELQPPMTAPVAVNVRGVDPSTNRERGGSRPGLSPFVDAQPADVESGIQDLNVVVTARAEGLLAHPDSWIDGEDEGPWQDGFPPFTVEDPSDNPDLDDPDIADKDDPLYNPDDPGMRNPGPRVLPPGGTGFQPDPHIGPEEEDDGGGGPAGWVYVQQKVARFEDDSSGTRTDVVAFDDAVADNQLVVVVVLANYGENVADLTAPTHSVSDSLGNTYSLVSQVTSVQGVWPVTSQRLSLAVYYSRVNGGNVAVSVETTWPSVHTEEVKVCLLEYNGLATSTPFESAVDATGSASAGNLVSAGPHTPGGSDRLILGVIAAKDNCTFSGVAAGFTSRVLSNTGNNLPGTLFVLEDLSSGVSAQPEANVTPGFLSSVAWCAVTASWRHS